MLAFEKYTKRQRVEVQINNPKNGNKTEWRKGIVIDCVWISGEKHRPYPMLLVEAKRTYCKAEPIYKTIDVNGTKIQVFVDNTLEFYDNVNTEGFVYTDEVRPLREFMLLVYDKDTFELVGKVNGIGEAKKIMDANPNTKYVNVSKPSNKTILIKINNINNTQYY